MIKFYLTIIITLFTLFSSNCQSFKLTPDGFKTIDGNEYLVIDFETSNKDVLFKNSLIYFNSIYKSPQNVISLVENESITINGKAKNSIKRNSMNIFDMDYTITFLFKDGKIRINPPNFELKNSIDHSRKLHVKWAKISMNGYDLGIYGKNDKLKSESAKNDLENYFNTFLNDYINSLKTNKNSDW
ncbi:DUF4468 domain-containing protein [Lutibacter maritimus]|uniref:DUF4468 domain-containing protein n=1 Tax=Lutibacter maritimus TaxID=593133 RepID=A0A1I6NR46_9FLAO|nr:DUF4468 domain-containing protein [Lutibacter maritimus]SFS30387.1 protein of unknown function [Lutibacter maritimus]